MLEITGSPTLNQSLTILKAFDGRGFHPFGILQDFPIGVEGKIVNLDVEVVDAPRITTFSWVVVGLML